MFSVPWVHCEVSSEGRPGQRQEKVPAWSWARSARLGGGPVAVKPTGRKLSPASSCCRRRVSPAATSNVTVCDAARMAPSVACTPADPPGIVSTSRVEGMSGESRA